MTDFSVNQDQDKMIFNTNIYINTRGGKQFKISQYLDNISKLYMNLHL